MEKKSKIYVAGHSGLLGTALCRQLRAQGYENLIRRTHSDLDLRNQQATQDFFKLEKPEYVFLCAARVGGIGANRKFPSEFLYDNLMIQANVIEAAKQNNIKKLLFTASNCVYPSDRTAAIREEEIFSGPFEPTNEAYAIAKMAGIRMCQYYNKQYGSNFIVAIPASLFGPKDSFELSKCHLLPALIARIDHAKIKKLSEITLWGTGTPLRELIYSENCAEGLIFLMQRYEDSDPINVGTGEDLTVSMLAKKVAETIGHPITIHFDVTKPDGMKRKLLDVSKLKNLGWKCQSDFSKELETTYQDYLKSHSLQERSQLNETEGF